MAFHPEPDALDRHRKYNTSQPPPNPCCTCIHVAAPLTMASPSGARSAGQKKVVTYGASSRKKPHPPGKSIVDSNSHIARRMQTLPSAGIMGDLGPNELGSSVSPIRHAHLDASPTRSGDGAKRASDGRKRDHATAFGAKGGPKQPASLNPEKAVISKSRTETIATVVGKDARKMSSKSPINKDDKSVKRLHPTAHRDRDMDDSWAGPRARHNEIPARPAGAGASTPTTTRRRRLIDTLAAQRDVTPENEEGLGEAASPSLARRSIADQDSRLQETDRRSGTPASSRIKFTYSQARSTLSESQKQEDLAETPLLGGEDDGIASEARGPSSPLAPPSFGFDDLPDDEETQPAIKSVHELRRAGANHRVSDEMDDLLGRIGNPEGASRTMRRNALCELAHRLQRESFAVKFRDHPSRDNVAKGVGNEKDPTSAFALAAAVVVLLDRGPAPHLERRLCDQGLGRLLGRLLQQDGDIDVIASQIKANVPGMTRASLREVKNDLLQMHIWHGTAPRRLCPRTLGLRLLETLSRCSEHNLLRQVMGELEQELVVVAADCADAEEASEDADYRLVLHCLEVLSSAGIIPGSGDAGAWASQHPASIAKFLSRAVEGWPLSRGETQDAALKLAINTTNTEHGARFFDDSKLLSKLAERVVVGIVQAQQAVGSGPLENDLFDGLLLILGLMINIVEHCPSARASVEDKSLDDLVQVWRENQRVIREVCEPYRVPAADSVDKSKLGVAVEYLSVFLGYLCLSKRGREKMGGGDGIRSLIGSIRDFAALHKAIDGKSHELEVLVTDLRRLAHSG
ncbi:rheb small monomeric gtpase [Purpureocillium lilacinum]|uniref:Rheb small monomeric gtpase n=1 Tax=Purpureocillium lilacinum TaxID=33203 RepID=A0A179GII7_PURLI|nr:rheb small monomeric gtpase [Purpureocillium lilacinum]